MKGGARKGAGRPKKPKEDISKRKSHNVRATETEWQVIHQFIKLVRKKDEKSLKKLLENL